MTKYAEILSGILETKSLRKSDLVNELKIPDSTVRGWWAKDSIPSADVALKVAKFLGVSVEYLLTGKDASFQSEPSEIDRRYSALTPSQKKAVETVIDSFLEAGEEAETTA